MRYFSKELNVKSIFKNGNFSGLVSGVLLALTLPPLNFGPLIFIGLVPLFIFLFRGTENLKSAFTTGFLTGFVYLWRVVIPLLSLNAWWWFPIDSIVYDNKGILLFWVIYLAVLLGSVLWGLFAAFVFLVWKRAPPILYMVIFAAAFASMEYARASLLEGFTWGHVGYALHAVPVVFKEVFFFGIYGASFFVAAVNIFFALCVLQIIKKGSVRNFDEWKPSILAGMVIVVFLASASILRLETNRNMIPYTVAVVQPGLTTEELKEKSLLLEPLIEEAISKNPDIIVLPENIFPLLEIDENEKAPGVVRPDENLSWVRLKEYSVVNSKITIFLGAHTTKDGKKFNSIIVLRGGVIVSVYHKRDLVPLAETGLWGIMNPQELFGKGDVQQMRAGDILVEPRICSEINIPAGNVKKGGAMMLSVGNDNVFNSPVVAEQHLIMAKARAVESGIYVVRAMKTGISTIINPDGVVDGLVPQGSKGVLFGSISSGSGS